MDDSMYIFLIPLFQIIGLLAVLFFRNNDEEEEGHKWEVWVSYNFGCWNLIFKRDFILPFVPTRGMSLTFDSEREFSVDLVSEYKTVTSIDYDIEKKQFNVNVSETWPRGLNVDLIDEMLEKYQSWERQDTTDIEQFKQLVVNSQINKL